MTGPWSYQHVYGNTYLVKCAGGQYHIGIVRAKQNAILIAAVTDLLSELENCADLLRVCFPDAPVDSCIGVAIIKAEAAISKATKGKA